MRHLRAVRWATLAGLTFFGLTVCVRDANPAPVDVHFKVAPGADPAGILGHLGAGTPEPLFPRSAAALRADRASPAVPDLTAWYQVQVPLEDAEALAAALDATPGVVSAFVAPVPELASVGVRVADGRSCPIRTPSYEPYQGYLSAAPPGIDVPAAWVRPGGRGSGVWFADVEGGWNAGHEDLPGDRMTHVAGQPMADRGWIAHGTAVLGEVAGRDNGLGVTGIAPDVERIFTASIGGTSTAAAIDGAQPASVRATSC